MGISIRTAALCASLVLSASSIDAETIANQTLFSTLTTGSLAGTQFAATVSFDASQILPSGPSFVTLSSFDFTLIGVAFDKYNIEQGGQAIFLDGALVNVTGSFQSSSLPPNSPVHNITFGFGGNGVIGYVDLSNQFGSGSFVFVPEPAFGWIAAGLIGITALGFRRRRRGFAPNR
jgi:hypothetical protein